MAPSECLSQQRASTSPAAQTGPSATQHLFKGQVLRSTLAAQEKRWRWGFGAGGVRGVGAAIISVRDASPRQAARVGSVGRGVAGELPSDSNRLTLDCCFVIGANCKENSADERRKCSSAPTRVLLLLIGLFDESRKYK